MSMEQVNTSMKPWSSISHQQKKQILWNIIQPGDPYDIRKSMIVKMPGSQNTFMGEYIELVCLMQAAQIERLCQYLEEYKLKYREVERRELDRHLYEVQIKELTQQLIDQGYHKTENTKLRDFLKKQSDELEEMRKNSTSFDGVENKYKDALKEIEGLIQENASMKSENRSLQEEKQQMAARLTAMESTKERELDQLRDSLANQSNMNVEREKQQLSYRYQTELNRLQLQIKRVKQSIESKNREIEQLQGRNRKLQMEISEQRNKNQSFRTIENNLSQYENKFGVLSKQIERLNYVLRNKSNQCQENKNKMRGLEQQLAKRNPQIEEYTGKIRAYEQKLYEANTIINELNQKLSRVASSQPTEKRMQQKIEQLSQEVNRLNNVLTKKVGEIAEYQTRLNDMQYEIKKMQILKKENQQLKQFYYENNALKVKYVEMQNKLRMNLHEMEELKSMVKKKNDECHNWQIQWKGQSQKYRAVIDNLQNQLANHLRSRSNVIQQQNNVFQRDNEQLRIKIQSLTQQNNRILQYENKLAMMSQEMQRLNQIIRGMHSQNEEYKRKIYDSVQMSRKNGELESRLKAIGQQCDGLRRNQREMEFKMNQEMQSKISTESKIRQFVSDSQDSNRRMQEYERAISSKNQELERISMSFRKKGEEYSVLEARCRQFQQEYENIRKKLGEYESRMPQINQEYQIQISQFDMKLKQVMAENEQYRRRINELTDSNRKVNEYESRLTMLSQQKQRLSASLRIKLQQNTNLQSRAKMQQQQIDNLKRGSNQYEYRLTQISQQLHGKLTIYQTSMLKYKQENQQLRRKIQQYMEINKRVVDYQNRNNILSQELDRMTNNYRGKVEENSKMESILKNMMNQNQNIKRIVGEYEYKIKQICQECQNQINQYENKIKQVYQENEELKRWVQSSGELGKKIGQYESRLVMATQELDKMNGIVRGKQDENSQLEYRLKESYRQIEQYRKNQNQLQGRLRGEKENSQQLIKKLKELNMDINIKIQQYENRIILLSQQLQRIKNGLKNKIDQSSGLQSVIKRMQQENQFMKRNQNEMQNRIIVQYKNKVMSYELKIKESDQQVMELRKKIQQLTDVTNRMFYKDQEVDRLTMNMKVKTQENEHLQETLRSMQQQINSYKVKSSQMEDSLRGVSQLNEDFRRKIMELSEQNKVLYDYENKIEMLSKELEKMGSNLRMRGDQLKAVQQENQNLRVSQGEITKQVQRRMEIYESQIHQLENENIAMKQKQNTLQYKINEYEYKMVEMNQDLQRMGGRHKLLEEEHYQVKGEHSSMEYKVLQLAQQLQNKTMTYDNTVKQLNQENEKLKYKLLELNDTNNKLYEYQNKIVYFKQQLQRVNYNLKTKVQQNTDTQNQLLLLANENQQLKKNNNSMINQLEHVNKQYEYKLQSVLQENENCKKYIGEINNKIGEYEEKITVLSQQLERININLRNKVEENNGLVSNIRSLQMDNQNLRRQHSDADLRTSQQYKSQIQSYQLRIRQTVQQNDALKYKLEQLIEMSRKIMDYENRIGTLSNEIQRLNDVLKLKVQQNTNLSFKQRTLQQSNKQYEYKIQQIIEQYQIKIKNYEMTINGDMRYKIQELEQYKHKLMEGEEKGYKMAKELQRINGLLLGKNNQCASISMQYKNLEVEFSKVKNMCNELEHRTNYEQQEKQDMKSKLFALNEQSRRNNQYEGRIAMLSQQMQRLNTIIRTKNDENLSVDGKWRNMQQEVDTLRRNKGEFESKIMILTQEKQRLSAMLRKNGDQLDQYHQKDYKYLVEIERLNNTLRLKIEESSKYQATQNQLINRMKALQQRNNQIIGQYNILRNTNTMLSTEYQNSKKHLLEYQQSIKKLYAQFERLQNIMKDLKKQNSNLKNEMNSSDSVVQKNKVLSAEIDRLGQIIEGLKNQIGELRIRFADETALQQRINEHMALMVVLFAEIQSLRQRVKEKEKEVEDVRRSSLAPFIV